MPSFKSLILSSIVSSQLIFGFKVKPESAKHVLKSRTKRHNQNFFEETLASDMQRECYDEKCSLEEFVEAYENTDANARTTKSDQVQLAYDQLRKPCEFKACHSMNTLRCEQKWNNAECKLGGLGKNESHQAWNSESDRLHFPNHLPLHAKKAGPAIYARSTSTNA